MRVDKAAESHPRTIHLSREERMVGRDFNKLGRSECDRTISKGKADVPFGLGQKGHRPCKPAASWATIACVSEFNQYNSCRVRSLQVLCMHAAICSTMVKHMTRVQLLRKQATAPCLGWASESGTCRGPVTQAVSLRATYGGLSIASRGADDQRMQDWRRSLDLAFQYRPAASNTEPNSCCEWSVLDSVQHLEVLRTRAFCIFL